MIILFKKTHSDLVHLKASREYPCEFQGEHRGGARASGHGYVSARFARLEMLVFTCIQQGTGAITGLQTFT